MHLLLFFLNQLCIVVYLYTVITQLSDAYCRFMTDEKAAHYLISAKWNKVGLLLSMIVLSC